MKLFPFLLLLTSFICGCGQPTTPKSASGSVKDAPEISKMNPNDILFSLPSLNDALPTELGAAAAGDDCYRMHEDNWRQFEFVEAAFEPEIASEIEHIDRIWVEQSVPLGDIGTAFRNLHIRKRIPKPLNIALSIAEFEKLFGQPISPITFIDYQKVLSDVHAVRLKNVIIYGRFERDRLTTLGIEPMDRFVIAGDVADRLERFVTEHDLRLIHWPSRTRFESTATAMSYLRGKGKAVADGDATATVR